jgi:hypothetical protein
MDNAKMVSLATNVGFSCVFAFAFAHQISTNSFDSQVFNKVYFGLAIAAAVISFLLLLVMLREFKKEADRKYSYGLKKKADAFSIFGLSFCMADAICLSLQQADYHIPNDIIACVFVVGVLFLALSRHYRHKARMKTQYFTSIGSSLLFIQLLAPAILCYQAFTSSMVSKPILSNEKTIIFFSLLGISLLGATGLFVKDVYDACCPKDKLVRSNFPKSYPYKISQGLVRKAEQEFSMKNILFINQANKVYRAYIKSNNVLLDGDLKSKIINLYNTYIVVNASDVLNIESRFKQEGKEVLNNYIVDENDDIKDEDDDIKSDSNDQRCQKLMKNLSSIYDQITKLLNLDTRMRHNKDVELFAGYCWLFFPSMGMLLGGLSGYGIQRAFGINELYVIASCMVGWLIGYGIGEAIFCGNNKFSKCCKKNMESLNYKFGCA